MSTKEQRMRLNAVKAAYKQAIKSSDYNIQFAKMLMVDFPNSYFSIIKASFFTDLWKDVLDKTRFLDSIYKDTDITRLYYYVNELTEVVKCHNQKCNKDYVKSFSPLNPPEYFHCSISCAQSDQVILDKVRHTKEVNHTTTRDLLERTKARNLE